jgi:hypothetical protein
MIADKKEFYGGFGLLVGFFVVLAIMFMPIFEGQNALNYLDSLYNTISKGSAYYIPKLRKDVADFKGEPIAITIGMKDPKKAEQTALLFSKSEAAAEVSGSDIKISGDFTKIMGNCLDDADNMFNNNGKAISEKYGYPEKEVMFNWWTAIKAMDKELGKQGKFKETKLMASISKKGVECSYNYYKIVPQKISEKIGIVVFSLVFYVIYTLWYGYAIMFMFEGWGLKLSH